LSRRFAENAVGNNDHSKNIQQKYSEHVDKNGMCAKIEFIVWHVLIGKII
jgi:hypothetical protein